MCTFCNNINEKDVKRRNRFGHIILSSPVVHRWFYKTISLLIGITQKELESIAYYEKYLITSSGNSKFKKMDIITREYYLKEIKSLNLKNIQCESGGKVIQDLLLSLNYNKEIKQLKLRIEKTKSEKLVEELLLRIECLELFRINTKDNINKPEWMVVETLPVIPLGLRIITKNKNDRKMNLRKGSADEQSERKIVDLINTDDFKNVSEYDDEENKNQQFIKNKLNSNKHVTKKKSIEYIGDINELYSRIIRRNNILKELLINKADEKLITEAKVKIQESFDNLIDNSKSKNPYKKIDYYKSRDKKDTYYKSLCDRISGKKGRLRENLLGKRVDFSGRSVIVVDPTIKLFECSLPIKMAIELYKPLIIREILKLEFNKDDLISNLNQTLVDKFKRCVIEQSREVIEILNRLVKLYPVILNRQPTLHRYNLQSFYAVLNNQNTIGLHPLVFSGFNADIDGDTMSVHLPLSVEAQLETKTLMSPTNNLISHKDGNPIITPTQDIVLGCYYLTMFNNSISQSKLFKNNDEVIHLYETKKIGLHTKIKFEVGGKEIVTSTGRIIFNKIIPKEIGFVNEHLNKSTINKLIKRIIDIVPTKSVVKFLDNLKEIGFKYATESGITIAMDELISPFDKNNNMNEDVKKIQENSDSVSQGDIYNKFRFWSVFIEQVKDKVAESLKEHKNGFNSINIMVESGARGTKEQMNQLLGIRGLMSKPTKTKGIEEVIEDPILSNFKKGLSVQEYFISCHGSRKSLIDKSLNVRDSGYLTRKLVHAARDVIITETDCFTKNGLEIESDYDDIIGRYSVNDIMDDNKNKIVISGELINHKLAAKIIKTKITKVKVRSVLYCKSLRGVCSKCYGWNISTSKDVTIGEAVGIIAAQSIGEPATQLTLRNFHTGGVIDSNKKDITGSLPMVENILEFMPKIKSEILNKFNNKPVYEVFNFLISNLQKIYSESGITIKNKHFEIIIRQMFQKIIKGSNHKETILDEENIVCIKGIRETAISKDGILTNASFEDTARVLSQEAIMGRKLSITDSIEEIMLGLLPKIGTGFIASLNNDIE